MYHQQNSHVTWHGERWHQTEGKNITQKVLDPRQTPDRTIQPSTTLFCQIKSAWVRYMSFIHLKLHVIWLVLKIFMLTNTSSESIFNEICNCKIKKKKIIWNVQWLTLFYQVCLRIWKIDIGTMEMLACSQTNRHGGQVLVQWPNLPKDYCKTVSKKTKNDCKKRIRKENALYIL